MTSPSSTMTNSSTPPPKNVTIKINGRDSPHRSNATVTSRNSDETANAGQQAPPDVLVSFHESTEPAATRPPNGEPEEVVLVCSSNNSFRQKPSLMRSKTKSRLLDPPEESNPKCQTARMVKSQVLLGLGTSEMDEDDPFLEEDLPEDYKKMKFSALSIVQLVSLIVIIAALVCSLTINVLKRRTVFGLELWKWEIMVLVLISGRLVSGLVIRIVVFFIERNFLLRKRVLYFVYGLKNAVQNCVWLALVLIAWQCIFDQKVESVTHRKILPYVTKIWVCLLSGTLIWLLKTLLIKVLASSFHVSAFFDRIQESLFSQYVIEKLSGPPLVEIQRGIEEEGRVMVEVRNFESADDIKASNNMFPKSGRVIETPRKSTVATPEFARVTSKKEEMNGITIDQLHRLNQKNISAWNMKRLMNIVKRGMISNLDEKLEGSNGEDQITTENQAIAAAKNIFLNVSKPGSKYIFQQDLLRFMRDDEVSRTMRLFDCPNNQKGITKRALKIWILNAFRERRALALSLNDTKTAVNKLHQMLNVLVGVLIVVIWLLILRVATTHFFIFLSSQLLVVVFMFGNTCKTTFEAIIFLFVMHPFDVGDRVEVDGVQMVVEEMNILTTVFLKYDNHKIYYPNSVLSTKPIYNYYRSPDMGDEIDFCISVSTPREKIAIMKERITSYCNNRCDHWYPDPMIVMREIEDMNRLSWSVWLTHKLNFQDMGERWLRRSLLVEEMVIIFRDLDIQYRMLPRDINVRNMPPITSGRFPSNLTTVGASA